MMAVIYQLNTTMQTAIPGPGSWVLWSNSTCPMQTEVLASGAPDFVYKFSAGFSSSFIALSVPILGTIPT